MKSGHQTQNYRLIRLFTSSISGILSCGVVSKIKFWDSISRNFLSSDLLIIYKNSRLVIPLQ